MGWTKTGTIPATVVTDANVGSQISGGTATGVALAAKIRAAREGATAVLTSSATPAVDIITRYDASAANRTPTLPALSTLNDKDELGVQRTESTTGKTVTFTCAGSDTFDSGATSLTLSYAELRTLRVVTIGGTKFWKVAGGNTPKSTIDTQIQTVGDARYGPITAAQVSALTYPLVIAHRGAGNIFPESTLTAYQNAAGLPIQVVEAGDYQAASDGGIVDFHDATVDRTTTSTGNVSSFSTPGMKRLIVDASSWFGGGWPDSSVSTLPEVLGAVGGLVVISPEVKDLQDSTSTAICKKIKALGLKSSVILQSFTLSNLTVADAAGISTLFLTGSLTGTFTPATLAAAGVSLVGVDYTAAGDKAAFAASMHAVGLKVIGYTVDRQVDYDLCIDTYGFDGVFSNDPLYVNRGYSTYRKTSTSWNLNGTWGHGYIPSGLASGTGPFTAAQRGGFVGAAPAFRWRPPASAFVLAGEVCPVAAKASTYTITAKVAFESVFTTTSNGACLFVAADSDNPANFSGNLNNSYLVKVRQSGVINAWEVNNSGTATTLGTGITATAPSIPVTSGSLTAGAAITSIPVNALTVALKTGHQFILPTGQTVTLTANASASATSVTVASVTPAATIPSATGLIPLLTITIAVTPTTITIARTDETGSPTTIAATNNAHRGGYIHLQDASAGDATGRSSFLSVSIS